MGRSGVAHVALAEQDAETFDDVNESIDSPQGRTCDVTPTIPERLRGPLLLTILISASVFAIWVQESCVVPRRLPRWRDQEWKTVETPEGPRRFKVGIHNTRPGEPAAVVVVFHSYYYEAEFAQQWHQWKRFAHKEDQPLIVLYPDGKSDSLRSPEIGMPWSSDDWTRPIRGWNALGNAPNSTTICDNREEYKKTMYGYYPGYASCRDQGHALREFLYRSGNQSGLYQGAGLCDSGPCSDDVCQG